MAMGNILINTEQKGYKALYMPKYTIEVEDGVDLGEILLKLQPSYQKLWKECQENPCRMK